MISDETMVVLSSVLSQIQKEMSGCRSNDMLSGVELCYDIVAAAMED